MLVLLGQQHGQPQQLGLLVLQRVQVGQQLGTLIMKLEKHGIITTVLLIDMLHIDNGDLIVIKVIKSITYKRPTSVGLFFA